MALSVLLLAGPRCSAFCASFPAPAGERAIARSIADTCLLSFSLGQDTAICSGDSLRLGPDLASDTLSFLWFPSGNTAPRITITAPGMYVLQATGDSGCVFADSIVVSVNPAPAAALSAPAPLCFGDTAVFLNNSSALPGATFSWIFGDGAASSDSSPEVRHLYTMNGGIFEGRLIVNNNNGCRDTATFSVQVDATPVVSISGPGSACFGQTATFGQSSAALPGALYEWDFGDGTTILSGEPMVQHDYQANGAVYDVRLTITNVNGCSATASARYEVLLLPAARFEADTACFRESTAITNNSTDVLSGASYTLHFGDGNTEVYNGLATLQYAYSMPGPYTLILIADNENGCADTAFLSTLVHPLPVAAFTGLDVSNFCLLDPPVELSGTPAGGAFSGLNVENTPNPNDGAGFFNPLRAGQDIEVIYRYTDLNNCSDADTQLVANVFPLPDVSFTGLREAYCLNDEPDTLRAGTPGGAFSGDAELLSTLGSGIALFDPSVIRPPLEISYAYTDQNGCADTFTLATRVNELPVVELGPDRVISFGEAVALGGPPVGNYRYEWSNLAATSSITVEDPGFYALYVEDLLTGCRNADTVLVTFGTAVQDYGRLPFRYGPNPAGSVLRLVFPEGGEAHRWQAHDSFGRLAKSGKLPSRYITPGEVVELSLHGLPAGMYWIRIGRNAFRIMKD